MNKLVFFALAAASLPAQQLLLVSGTGQLMLEQFPASQPMVVRAVDAAGRPVAGVPVQWAVTRGQGTIRNPQTSTDSDGLARSGFLATSIQPGSSYLQTVVTASSPTGSAQFYMITTQSIGLGAAQPIIQVYGPQISRGTAGSVVPEAFTVVVAASSGAFLGQGIPNVGVRVVPIVNPDSEYPTAACDAPSGILLTDARGRAVCNLLLGPTPGTGAYVVNIGEISSSRQFGIEVTPGQSCSVSLNPAVLNFGSSGGSATFQVSAVNCPWTATAAAPWVSSVSPTSGSASGAVAISVQPNPGPARSTVISVGNATLTVNQSAAGVNLPLSFASSQTLPVATAGIAYSTNLVVSGGQLPYTWVASGALPPGLNLNSSTGALTGVVATPGTYPVPVTVRDAAGAAINQTFSVTVNSAQNPGSGAGLSIATASLPNGIVNFPYNQSIAASGGCPNPFFGPPRLEIVSGGLPPGMTARSGEGNSLVISGTPAQAGTFAFAVRASDACGAFVTREFTLSISSAPSVTPMTASSIGLAFNIQRGASSGLERSFTVSTGTSAVSFTARAVSDGNWLSVTPESGTTAAELTARVTNTNLPPGVYNGSITIVSEAPNSPLTIPATLVVNAAQSLSVAPSTLTFEFEPGGLVPAAQTVNVTTGGASVPFTATASTSNGGSWLTVSQSAAVSPAFISVLGNPAGLPPGVYTGAVTVTPAFNIAPVTIPVVLTVASRVGPAVSSVANGASFVSGPVAPGQILTIFGRDMGPATLATYRLTPTGTIDTQLAEVRVLFDDLPAPLLYVSATQTTVIVPYGVAGRVFVRMQIEYRGVRSAALQVPVAESAPGLFTIGGGLQGAILNQDSTTNGAQNGAQPGSTISLFATGEGVTAPASVEGAIVSPLALAKPVLPVSVTIAGRIADVTYAGSAPGLPAGVMQVNVRVPADVPVGAPAQVVLTVGSASSQPGVTVFVRP